MLSSRAGWPTVDTLREGLKKARGSVRWAASTPGCDRLALASWRSKSSTCTHGLGMPHAPVDEQAHSTSAHPALQTGDQSDQLCSTGLLGGCSGHGAA